MTEAGTADKTTKTQVVKRTPNGAIAKVVAEIRFIIFYGLKIRDSVVLKPPFFWNGSPKIYLGRSEMPRI